MRRKTFYSVQYREWGAIGPRIKWFDNAEEAREFSKRDYSDNMIVHSYKDPKEIERVETLIKEQRMADDLGY